jgi:hypothetical protein
VRVSTQVTDLVTKPLDKRSHNFIFSMLRRYYYLVNPSCAMAAQGMKTVYADPWNTSM